jgi:hypothetical protein
MIRPEPNTGVSYKRGQVEGALWRGFAGPFFERVAGPPSTFVRRIRKFIELGVGSDTRPGAGTDIGFDLVGVFELGIALDLQDMGLNQLEVVRFVTMYRHELRAALAEMDLTPGQGKPVLMLVRTRAATEPARLAETLPMAFSAKQTIWYAPEFLAGAESVGQRLNQLGGRDRKRIVIEVRDLALLLADSLPRMPAKKRGRQ